MWGVLEGRLNAGNRTQARECRLLHPLHLSLRLRVPGAPVDNMAQRPKLTNGSDDTRHILQIHN